MASIMQVVDGGCTVHQLADWQTAQTVEVSGMAGWDVSLSVCSAIEQHDGNLDADVPGNPTLHAWHHSTWTRTGRHAWPAHL